MSPAATLRRFLPAKTAERCGVCGVTVGGEHEHLVDVEARRIVCACQPCAVLFSHRGAKQYRRIGRDIRYLAEPPLTDAEWESLHIPIGLAFFFCSTPASRMIAVYPGPAGPTESLLPVALPVELEPDIEALLVNRVAPAREHYIVPIDCCYRLTGLIRLHWRGLSGGNEVWHEISNFFAALRGMAHA